MSILHVIPLKRLPFGKTFFEYACPKEHEALVRVGSFVELPWRKGRIWGVVWRIHQESTYSGTVKSVTAVASYFYVPEDILVVIMELHPLWATSPSTALLLVVPQLPKKIATFIRIYEDAQPIVVNSVTPHSFSVPSSWSSILTRSLRSVVASSIPLYIQSYSPRFRRALLLAQVKYAYDRKKTYILVCPSLRHLHDLLPYLVEVVPMEHIIFNPTSLSEYASVLKKQAEGTPLLVLGLRSVVWAPVRADMYCVDDEDDPEFKEERHPHYTSSQVACARARASGGHALIMGSMRTLSTSYAIRNGTMRYDAPLLPLRDSVSTTYVSLRDERVGGNMSYISGELERVMNDALSKGESVVLYHNRKGWGKRYVCVTCHADSYEPSSDICPFCKTKGLRAKSVGTARLDAWVKNRFSSVPILRIEGGTHDMKIAIPKGSIIIATQSLFSFPPLSFHEFGSSIGVVAIIALENNFSAVDYTKNEAQALLVSRMQSWATGVGAKEYIVQHWGDTTYNEEEEIQWRIKLGLPL